MVLAIWAVLVLMLFLVVGFLHAVGIQTAALWLFAIVLCAILAEKIIGHRPPPPPSP